MDGYSTFSNANFACVLLLPFMYSHKNRTIKIFLVLVNQQYLQISIHKQVCTLMCTLKGCSIKCYILNQHKRQHHRIGVKLIPNDFKILPKILK